MSGLKVVGCCAHVATLITYLSYSKYHTIKIPGEFLNSILVDVTNRKPSNQPKIVRNKRSNSILISSSESDDSENASESDIDESNLTYSSSEIE